MKLSLVIPCYNEQDNVELFYNTATEVFKDKGFDYELIFVNDGSRDQTMDKLRHIYEIADENVKVVGFSRNFGKESAIYAGLKESKGEMVCLIDADMQQRPELVLDMMAILDKDPNYDAVACYQEDRRESKVLSAFKDCFYKIINKTSEIEFKSGASDFRLLRRCVVDAVLSMSEYHRFPRAFSRGLDSTHIICPISLKTAQTALPSGTLRSSSNMQWTALSLLLLRRLKLQLISA